MANGVNNENFFNKLMVDLGEKAGKTLSDDKIEKVDIANIFAKDGIDANKDGEISLEEFLSAAGEEFNVDVDELKHGEYKELIDTYSDDYADFAAEYEVAGSEEEEQPAAQSSEREFTFQDKDGNVTGGLDIRDDLVPGSTLEFDPATGKYTITFGGGVDNTTTPAPVDGEDEETAPVDGEDEETAPVDGEDEETAPVNGEDEEKGAAEDVTEYRFTDSKGGVHEVNVPDGYNNVIIEGNELVFEYPDGSLIKQTVAGLENTAIASGDMVELEATDANGNIKMVTVPDGYVSSTQNGNVMVYEYEDGSKIEIDLSGLDSTASTKAPEDGDGTNPTGLTNKEIDLMEQYTDKFNDYIDENGVLDFNKLRDEVLEDMAANPDLSVEAKMQLLEKASELIGEKGDDGKFPDGKTRHRADAVAASILEQINADDTINVQDSLEFMNRFQDAMGYSIGDIYNNENAEYNIAMLFNKVENADDFVALYNECGYNASWSYQRLPEGKEAEALKAFYDAAYKTGWFDENSEGYISPDDMAKILEDGAITEDDDETRLIADFNNRISSTVSAYNTYTAGFADDKNNPTETLLNLFKNDSQYLSYAAKLAILEKAGIKVEGNKVSASYESGQHNIGGGNNPYRDDITITLDADGNIESYTITVTDHTHNDSKIIKEYDKDGKEITT